MEYPEPTYGTEGLRHHNEQLILERNKLVWKLAIAEKDIEVLKRENEALAREVKVFIDEATAEAETTSRLLTEIADFKIRQSAALAKNAELRKQNSELTRKSLEGFKRGYDSGYSEGFAAAYEVSESSSEVFTPRTGDIRAAYVGTRVDKNEAVAEFYRWLTGKNLPKEKK